MDSNRKYIKSVSNQRARQGRLKIPPNKKYDFRPFVIEKQIELGLSTDIDQTELYTSMQARTSHRSKLSERVKSVSRTRHCKFASETFYSFNPNKVDYGNIKNTLPLSPQNSDVGSLIDIKPKITTLSRSTAPSHNPHKNKILKSLLNINLDKVKKGVDHGPIQITRGSKLLVVKSDLAGNKAPPTKHDSETWVNVTLCFNV